MSKNSLAISDLEAKSLEIATKMHTRHIVAAELSEAAFGYARYSDDGQDPMSIDRQVEGIRRTNKEHGLPEPEIFIDEAKSGQNLIRSGAQALITALDRKQNFGASLTFESGDRLFRSLMSYVEIQACCTRNSVRLYTHKGPLQEEHLPLEAMISLMEIKKFRHRAEFKRTYKRKAGLSSAMAPWGLIKAEGKNVPDPERKEWVIEIFKLAAAGVTPGSIARLLNESGVKPTRAKLWSSGTILSMLTNATYDGRTFNLHDDD